MLLSIKEQITMSEYAASINAISGKIVAGPKGDFIVFTLPEGKESFLPVGGKSQGMDSPLDLEVLLFDNGSAVATANQYVSKDEVTFG